MNISLSREDNDIIVRHLYEYNEGVDVEQRMSMDCYINEIDFTENDLVFKCLGIETILYGDIITDKIIPINNVVGKLFEIKLSEFESPYNQILMGAIREIKLRRLI